MTRSGIITHAVERINAMEARYCGLRARAEYGVERIVVGNRDAVIALHTQWADDTRDVVRWELVSATWAGVGAVSRFKDWWEAQPPTYLARRRAAYVPAPEVFGDGSRTDTKGT